MSDTFTIVIAIGITAVLIFVFPVIAMADRIDNISQSDVETKASEFLNEIATTGNLTDEFYSKFIGELNSTRKYI